MRPASTRTFVAVEIPVNVLDQVGTLQAKLRSYDWKIRWVRTGNMHLTLKFLGLVPEKDLEGIEHAVSSTVKGMPLLSLRVRGVGVFPNVRRPRILWAGIGGDSAALREMQAAIEAALVPAGFAKEKRKFRPHVTLGRFKGSVNSRSLGEALVQFSAFSSEMFSIDRLFLFSSDLRPAGPVYSKLADFELANESTVEH